MRLIDADALVLRLDDAGKRAFGTDGIPECSSLSLVRDYVDTAPTVDAVEVVRCRECVHYNNNRQMYDDDVCEIMHYIDGTPRTACEEDFCSYGKRRGGR